MGRLTATMVVDLTDKTGGKTQAIIGNLNRLKRAERDYMLADKGLRLSNRDRALERLMMERERSIAERQAAISAWTARGATAALALGYGAARAYDDYAQLERRVNRIVVNADKGAEAIEPTIAALRKVSDASRTPLEEVVSGFEALIASGRSLEESLAFLPSVAVTGQASGAALSDLALSADALSGALKIDPGQMQRAFDILVAGGKAGKFELKDMAQYLPSLAPAFAALGYEGTDGLRKMAAMLQMVRNQAGSSGEAATYLGNVFNKMYSEETAKKFSKFHVDLPKALEKAKKEGKDVLDVFLDMTQIATRGDLSKLTLLFTDSEMQKGVRALLTQRDALRELNTALGNVDGTALKDFGQIAGDSAAKIQQLKNNWDTFIKTVGSGVATVANPVLEDFNRTMDRNAAISKALDGMDGEQRAWQRGDFDRAYRKLYPDAGRRQTNIAYFDALERVGRGQQKGALDDLKRIERNLELYDGGKAKSSTGRQNMTNELGALPSRGLPVPGARPAPETAAERQRRMTEALYGVERYPTHGAYDPDAVALERDRRSEAALPPPLRAEFMQRNVRAEIAIDAARRGRQMGFGGSTENLPGKLADDLGVGANGPREVSIRGTPSVTLSGTPTVTITNPPPRPNINVSMSVTINEAQNVDTVAQQLGQRVREEMNGLQASTNDSGL